MSPDVLSEKEEMLRSTGTSPSMLRCANGFSKVSMLIQSLLEVLMALQLGHPTKGDGPSTHVRNVMRSGDFLFELMWETMQLLGDFPHNTTNQTVCELNQDQCDALIMYHNLKSNPVGRYSKRSMLVVAPAAPGLASPNMQFFT